MNYLLAFIALDLINPLGLDIFMLPKVWACSLLIAYCEFKSLQDFKDGAILFLGLSVVAVYLSMDWSTSVLGSELMGFEGLIQIFIYLEIFRISGSLKSINEAIMVFYVPMLLYAFIQRLGYDYYHPSWAIPFHRAVSTQGNPVFLSITIGMLSPLAFHNFWTSKSEKTAYFLLILLVCLGLWAAGSKSGFLASGVGIISYLWFQGSSVSNTNQIKA